MRLRAGESQSYCFGFPCFRGDALYPRLWRCCSRRLLRGAPHRSFLPWSTRPTSAPPPCSERFFLPDCQNVKRADGVDSRTRERNLRLLQPSLKHTPRSSRPVVATVSCVILCWRLTATSEAVTCFKTVHTTRDVRGSSSIADQQSRQLARWNTGRRRRRRRRSSWRNGGRRLASVRRPVRRPRSSSPLSASAAPPPGQRHWLSWHRSLSIRTKVPHPSPDECGI